MRFGRAVIMSLGTQLWPFDGLAVGKLWSFYFGPVPVAAANPARANSICSFSSTPLVR